MAESSRSTPLENLPAIFLIGSSNVGKRTILSRLLSVDFRDVSDDASSSSQILFHGWTIDTKYYAADVCVWMGDLNDELLIANLPFYDRLAAVVLVFDLTDLSTLTALKDWVSRNDVCKFDVLLCIGNKVDLVPGHPVHSEYRRRQLQRNGESSDEITDFESEGASLLGYEQEQPAWDIRRSCLEWCADNNIEYIEACASNPDFDKCLSVNGDSQGVERLFGALSAYMWPGMILKSGDKIPKPSLPANEELSEEESEYEFEYEVLSAGLAEPWDDTFEGWVSTSSASTMENLRESSTQKNLEAECEHENGEKFDKEELQPSTSMSELQSNGEVISSVEEPEKYPETDGVTPFDFDDLEQLMSEIGNMRNSLRLMPDFQRREMAANLAMKMAAMFGGGSDDEQELD
ncbi:hypothetical protein K2173_016578 [Erythroxylum novogranatense]|uniref:Uncharacterized protein n=1 Tax=Erythroxylum novogranatense TaxID=1862640 RepID=A0AAV8SHA3_9ROSI|nr:hypothetical protein K2173_016578 [Erythroxylum novogranatense]